MQKKVRTGKESAQSLQTWQELGHRAVIAWIQLCLSLPVMDSTYLSYPASLSVFFLIPLKLVLLQPARR